MINAVIGPSLFKLNLITLALLSLPLSAAAQSPDYLPVIETEAQYKQLMRTKGINTSVKYLIETQALGPATVFQNTNKFEYHYPFVISTFPKYKNVSTSEFDEMLFTPPKKIFTAGAVYYVQKWVTTGIPTPGFVAFTLDYKPPFKPDEVSYAFENLKKSLPLANGKLAYAFEDPSEFFKYNSLLLTKGIPSMLLKIVEQRGNLVGGNTPVPSPSPTPTPAPTPLPNPEVSGTYKFQYHNHGWNSWTAAFESLKIEISTPEGSVKDPKQNMGPGFRPLLRYNKITVETKNQSPLAIMVWPSDNPKERDVFCRSVISVLPIGSSKFPVNTVEILPQFGIEKSLASKTCDLEIAKPKERPGFGNEKAYTGDIICMIPFRSLNKGTGPELISLYAPFDYHEKPIGPWLNEWPSKKIQICVDGVLAKVSEKN